MSDTSALAAPAVHRHVFLGEDHASAERRGGAGQQTVPGRSI